VQEIVHAKEFVTRIYARAIVTNSIRVVIVGPSVGASHLFFAAIQGNSEHYEQAKDAYGSSES
jgi:hypothetical protein